MFATPNDTCGMVTTVLAGLIALAFVILEVQQKRWTSIGTFAVVLALLAGCCQFGICRCVDDLRICFLLAILAANVVSLPQRATSDDARPETFTNPPTASANDESNSTTLESGSSTPTASTKDVDTTSTTTSTTPTIDSANSIEKDDTKDNSEDDKEPNYVDTFSTFMETYKSLTPGQIETMTSDTKDLIATQKSLMETVKSLAPVITQGREMMDTFKDYFGPNSHQDLMKAFKGGGSNKKE